MTLCSEKEFQKKEISHPEIMEELEKKVREHYQLGTDSSEKDEKEVKKEKEQKGKSDDLALKGDEK